ncbi:hypothetical protein SAMN04487968_107182 [Nocardioides terrae]|uniref:Uncharacterized protein n=1 Tax=Nocardioides terrae TaxID=574651 RepID=A0A1I1K256_9ACTN|nr:hypothetical protein [Nocardioides terrae]SFC52838.1 hypothetical protein SAMN04487968_107182 [Nocardioides terrae]
MHGGVLAVFIVVVAARLLVPLTIPRWPLPGIVASLVLDAVDHSVFQAFGYDPPEYQSYDKAMDVYYLAVAYLATLRNWRTLPAVEIGRFLYFYRLVGVVAFELAQVRALLLVFANTFEYFFIAYEVVRTRWDPQRSGWRTWLWVAAVIWIGVKLPQEWWIHIAQLDFTDAVTDHPWFGALVLAALAAATLVGWLLVWPRTPPADWSLRLSADRLPEQVDSAAEVAAWTATSGRLLSWVTAEKVLLVGLLCVLFAQVLPGVDADPTAVFVGVAVFVAVNAAITLAAHRRARSLESLAATFLVRTAANVVLVVAEGQVLGHIGGHLPYAHTLFFVVLLSMLTTMHERWHPVYDWRRTQRQAGS